ncbi:hypothetical protein [Viridibacterium curvum]|uniref:Uncharacterized protein n=1 Tax=Viridibacterium curvum TaxID=1101404 RepID=A0ABP9R773_9RHOO
MFRFTKALFTLGVYALTSQALTAQADPRALDLDDLMESSAAQKHLKSPIRLVWKGGVDPDLAERALPDHFSDFSRALINPCKAAFLSVLGNVMEKAGELGYDYVYLEGLAYDEGPKPEAGQVICDRGALWNRLKLSATMGVSKAGQAKQQALSNDPGRASAIAEQVAKRKAEGKSIFLPMASLFDSPGAKELLKPGEEWVWGAMPVPAFTVRKGADNHSEKVSLKNQTQEQACHEAGLKVLKEILKDMREDGFNTVIRIRSNYDDLPAQDGEYECKLASSSVQVALSATLVRRH